MCWNLWVSWVSSSIWFFCCLLSLLLCLSCTFLRSYHTCLEGILLALNHQNSHFWFSKDNWAKVMPSCSCTVVRREVKDQLKPICCDKAFSRGSPQPCWVIFPSQSKTYPSLLPPFTFFPLQHLNMRIMLCCGKQMHSCYSQRWMSGLN